MTAVAAAGKVGCNERTVRRRLEDPAFAQRVADAKNEAVGQAVALLGTLMTSAAVRLGRLLESPDERVRLAAAKTIIDSTLRGRQVEQIEAEVREIKDLLHEYKLQRKQERR